MIELPSSPAPNGVTPEFMDFGIVLRPATGAALGRVDRPGSRWKAEFTFPPMKPELARVFQSRIARGTSEGLRLTWPLLGALQGNPGVPVIDGSAAAGTSLPLRGLNAGYPIKEGYWLSVIDGDGVHYLHQVATGTAADSSGEATVTIAPALRAPLADGDSVLLARPVIEGLVTSAVTWPMTPDRLIPLSFTLEEQA